MKVKDIDTDTIYAYRTGNYDKPVPVRVLDTSRMYYFAGRQFGKPVPGTRVVATNERMKMRAADGHGLVAVSTIAGLRGNSRDVKPEAFDNPHKALLHVTLAEVKATTTDQTRAHHERVGGTGPHMVLVNPRFIVGEWETYWQQYNDDAESKDAARKAKAIREKDNAVRESALRDRLRVLGINVKPLDDWSVRMGKPYVRVGLSEQQIEALLSLIPEGARVPEGEWEYDAPEGTR